VLAAFAVVIASAVPAMACGWYGCSPCGPAYVNPCVASPVYVSPARSTTIRAATSAAAAGPTSGCPIRCTSIITSTRARPIAARQLCAVSDLSGKRVGVGWLSPPPQAPCAAPLLLTAISTDGSRRPFASCERAFALRRSAHRAELAGADIERQHRGVRDVEALDFAGHCPAAPPALQVSRVNCRKPLPRRRAPAPTAAATSSHRGSRCRGCRARPS